MIRCVTAALSVAILLIALQTTVVPSRALSASDFGLSPDDHGRLIAPDSAGGVIPSEVRTETPRLVKDGHVLNVRSGLTYSALQEAIDDAVDGDRLLVGRGTYQGSLSLTTNSLSIDSYSGAEETHIDAASDPIFFISEEIASIALSGFSLNGSAVMVAEGGLVSAEISIVDSRITADDCIRVMGEAVSESEVVVADSILELSGAVVRVESGVLGSVIEVLRNTIHADSGCIIIGGGISGSHIVAGWNTGKTRETFVLLDYADDSDISVGGNHLETTATLVNIKDYLFDSSLEISTNTVGETDYLLSFLGGSTRHVGGSYIRVVLNTADVRVMGILLPRTTVYSRGGEEIETEIVIGSNRFSGGIRGVNIEHFGAGKVRLTGNTFSHAVSRGLHIERIASPPGHLVEVTIRGNTINANQGGGIHIGGVSGAGESRIEIDSNRVANNRGDGIYIGGLTGRSRTTVYSNTIAGNSGFGLRLGTTGEDVGVSVEENSIFRNGVGLHLAGRIGQPAEFAIVWNDIYSNQIGMRNESGTLLMAIGNYWGHRSGPLHGENPKGEGDRIVGSILFSPWLEESNRGLAE